MRRFLEFMHDENIKMAYGREEGNHPDMVEWIRTANYDELKEFYDEVRALPHVNAYSLYQTWLNGFE